MLRRTLSRLLRALRLRRQGAPVAVRAAREPQAPLPAALAERLRRIPHSEILCRDLDRQWPELARDELAAARTAALRSHLEGCARCSRVLEVLAAAVAQPPRPLPARLFFRLAALARPVRPAPAPLPAFLRDGRWALAASALVATLLATAAGGDPLGVAARAVTATSSQVREAGPVLRQPVDRTRRWIEARGRDLAQAATVPWREELTHRRYQAAWLYETVRRRSAELEGELEEGFGQRLEDLKGLLPPALARPQTKEPEIQDPARSPRTGEETPSD